MHKTLMMTLGLLAACSTPTAGYHPDDCVTDVDSFGFVAYEAGSQAAFAVATGMTPTAFCEEYDGPTPHDPEYIFGRWHGIPLLEACYTFGWDMQYELEYARICDE